MRDFQGKVAVITGAASGIGRAFAQRFAREGMRMVLADIEQPPLDQLVQELRAAGHEATGVVTDVSKAAAVEQLARTALDTYGKVHVVFNNAGVSGGRAHDRGYAYDDPPAIWEASLADWTWITGVNYWGVAHGIRVFVPILLAQGEEGHVVNTASVAGLQPGGNVYGATKHAVVSMSESLRRDFARRGARIGVTCLCPTLVNTGIIAAYRNRPPELLERETIPDAAELERLRTAAARGLAPADVAELVVRAIRENEFYVLTNRSVDERIRERMEAILNRRDLAVPTTPGP
jgi:NAD(P)-dependent dehydrogenase (short-subunit alcohol dehydrogenase family)